MYNQTQWIERTLLSLAHDNRGDGRRMRRLLFACVIVAVAAAMASADYVTLDTGAAGGGWEHVGAGHYDFHYIYQRENTLTVGDTWSLHGVGFEDATGPVYWNVTPAVISNNGTLTTWTYDGGESGSQADSYTTFDVSAYMPHGNPSLVPYDINGSEAGNVLGPTPEPTTLLLTIVGIGALGAGLRRRED